jgi:hypothetical protein
LTEAEEHHDLRLEVTARNEVARCQSCLSRGDQARLTRAYDEKGREQARESICTLIQANIAQMGALVMNRVHLIGSRRLQRS